MALLSVIVPCYNEEENISFFYEELMKNSSFFEEKKLDLEVIYIDDGSKDQTVSEIKKLAGKDNRVKMISFSRNFGKEAAIFAGFQKALFAFGFFGNCHSGLWFRFCRFG